MRADEHVDPDHDARIDEGAMADDTAVTHDCAIDDGTACDAAFVPDVGASDHTGELPHSRLPADRRTVMHDRLRMDHGAFVDHVIRRQSVPSVSSFSWN